jgi:hypothetical protein
MMHFASFDRSSSRPSANGLLLEPVRAVGGCRRRPLSETPQLEERFVIVAAPRGTICRALPPQ